MTKNKGFTLIEVITVIALLGILATIAIPTIYNSIKNSKDELYEIQIKNIEVAAKNWGADNISSLPKNGDSINITLGKLKQEGYIDDEVINPKNKNKINDDLKITITNTDNVIKYKINN